MLKVSRLIKVIKDKKIRVRVNNSIIIVFFIVFNYFKIQVIKRERALLFILIIKAYKIF